MYLRIVCFFLVFTLGSWAHTYSLELNRSLSKTYGQFISAASFKNWVESNESNVAFRDYLTSELQKRDLNGKPFQQIKNLKIVISLGLGWREFESPKDPIYVLNFLRDIKSSGLPILFLKREPYGTLNANIAAIIPQLEKELAIEQDIILVSLSKGTPELMSALGTIHSQKKPIKARVKGYVNISGMVGGVSFADKANKLKDLTFLTPLLKAFPATAENGKTLGSLSQLSSVAVDRVMKTAYDFIPRETFFINITGLPLSNHIYLGTSPMLEILKIGNKRHIFEGANDGFLEAPRTLVSDSVFPNQVTVVLDSTHLIADGKLGLYGMDDQTNRRVLYQALLKFILNR